MDAANAWDLLDDDAKDGSQDSKSSSESYSSSDEASNLAVETEVTLKNDPKNRRSKSPAVESLRKVSRMVLEKVGIKKKKVQNYTPLSRTLDLPQFPFNLFCSYPKEFSYGHDKKKPKILSSETLRQKRPSDLKSTKEKCSYLFRSQASDEEHYAEAIWGTQSPKRMQVYDPFCPVHGSQRKLHHKRRQLLDMNSFMQSLDENDNLQPILTSDSYFAKEIRKRQRAAAVGAQGMHVGKSKRKIQQNLMILSFAFLFLFIGFHGLQYLQTSINGNVGGAALSAYYFSLAISSLIVPTFVVSRLGSKLTLITAFAVHLVYMLANFLPQYYSLIPVSILAGVAASFVVRFFGTFFLIVHCGQVVGSLISSLILSLLIETPEIIDQMDKSCGSGFPRNYSMLSQRAKINLERPSQLAYSSVVAIDLVCVIVALMIIAFFLNALKRDEIRNKKAPKFNVDVLALTLKNLQKPKVLLLIPLTVFNGIEQAFAVGLYTKAFVGCSLGIQNIGFVMTSFGVSNAVFSLVFGPLIKLFGRMPLFVFGAVINLIMIMTLMIWPVNPGDRAFFNVVASVLGMADSVWNTQIQGFWVGLTGRSSLEVAFANYRFWMSSGMAVGFLITRFTSVNTYLATSFVLLLISIFFYFLNEILNPIMAQLKKTGTKEAEKSVSAREQSIEPSKNTMEKV